jgi:DNA-binding NtrC family response regulator
MKFAQSSEPYISLGDYRHQVMGGLSSMADVVPFPVEHGKSYAVLVVDDEPAIRGVLCEFLKECGLSPISAENADEAMVLIQGGMAVDLVFSDVRMPGRLDGCALARWILENRPELPVILATGDLGKANAAAGLSGIETFAKPYDFDAAVKKIRDTIVCRQARRAAQIA